MNGWMTALGMVIGLVVIVGGQWAAIALVRYLRVRRFQRAVIEHFGPQLDNYREYVRDQMFGNEYVRALVEQLDYDRIDDFAKGLVDIELDDKKENRGNQTAG